MLIRFWFGAIHIGRPSRIGADGDYDADISFVRGWRGEVPPGEVQWHYTWRFAWNWLPDVVYQIEPEPLNSSEIAFAKLVATISSRAAFVPPQAVTEKTRWTERVKVIGFGEWRHAVTVHRSTWRSKMFVYLTGAKERRNPNHILRIAPAAVVGITKAPSDWLNDDGTAKPFEIKFVHGRASVDNQLGEWLIKTGQCQRTNLIRRTASTLGSLAASIRGV